jgi:hypothetical protein
LNAVLPEASKPRGSPKIQAAEELADDQQVGAAHALGLEGRPLRERRVVNRRPEIRKTAKRLAQGEERRFRAFRWQPAVEFWMADRASSTASAFNAASSVRSGRPGALAIDRDAADGMRRERKCLARLLGHILQNADRFLGDFGANAVAG